MPTTIKLSTMPAVTQVAHGTRLTSYTVDLFGKSLGSERATVARTADVAPIVKAFGERIRATDPEASFIVTVTLDRGQRKPPGYDAASHADAFGCRAFIRKVAEDGSTALHAMTAKAA